MRTGDRESPEYNSNQLQCVYLILDLLPDLQKGLNSVDVLTIGHMRYVQQYGGLAIDESIHNVFFQFWEVILNLLTSTHTERIVAV